MNIWGIAGRLISLSTYASVQVSTDAFVTRNRPIIFFYFLLFLLCANSMRCLEHHNGNTHTMKNAAPQWNCSKSIAPLPPFHDIIRRFNILSICLYLAVRMVIKTTYDVMKWQHYDMQKDTVWVSGFCFFRVVWVYSILCIVILNKRRMRNIWIIQFYLNVI